MKTIDSIILLKEFGKNANKQAYAKY